MEQLVILLLIALISLINWLIKKSAALREARKLEEKMAKTGESPRAAPPPKLEPPEFEPSLRRLKEALGLPDEALPPALPRRTQEKIAPAPALPEPPPLPEVRPLVLPRPVVSVRASAALHQGRRVHESHSGRAGSGAASKAGTSRIRELLGSPTGLRDAVVLSEILGQPKCLRPAVGRFPA
jgi:hypothetical protein